MDNYKKNKIEKMQFFFCNDDVEHCVKGSKQKWVFSKLEVPDIWPLKFWTNLIKKEMTDLQNARFHLLQCVAISLKRLFGDHELPNNVSRFQVPAFPTKHPSTRSKKKI